MKVNTQYINSVLDLLKSRNITITELAEVCGVSPRTIYDIRAKKRIQKSLEETIINALKQYYTKDFIFIQNFLEWSEKNG